RSLCQLDTAGVFSQQDGQRGKAWIGMSVVDDEPDEGFFCVSGRRGFLAVEGDGHAVVVSSVVFRAEAAGFELGEIAGDVEAFFWCHLEPPLSKQFVIGGDNGLSMQGKEGCQLSGAGEQGAGFEYTGANVLHDVAGDLLINGLWGVFFDGKQG